MEEHSRQRGWGMRGLNERGMNSAWSRVGMKPRVVGAEAVQRKYWQTSQQFVARFACLEAQVKVLVFILSHWSIVRKGGT